MANELYMTYDEGFTLYALVWRKSDDKVWSVLNSQFETYDDTNIDEYDTPLSAQVDSDYYSADFPSAITGSGQYRVQIMLQTGGAIDADADIGIAQGEIYWDGDLGEEIDLFSISGSIGIQLNEFEGTGNAQTQQVNTIIQ